MTTDAELVAAAQAGDSRALGQLYDRYAGLLYGFVYRHVVDHRQEAEDLTSDVMLRMVKQLPTYRHASTFKTWLLGIARHVIVDYWRTQYRLPTAALTDAAAAGAWADDQQSLPVIACGDAAAALTIPVDSPPAVSLLLRFAALRRLRYEQLEHANSAEMLGDLTIPSTTSYLTAYFSR